MSAKRARVEGNARVAIAFDIDGVFKYGREWSKDGLRALQKVTDAKMPFVFVTNGGGGLTEAAYASSMASKIRGASSLPEQERTEVVIDASRMVLSYTPWQTMLAPGLKDAAVLLIGDPKEKVLEVAHKYGLKHAVHYSDYAVRHYKINPFRGAKEGGRSHTGLLLALPNGPANIKPGNVCANHRLFTPSCLSFAAVANTTVANAVMDAAVASEEKSEKPFEAILVMCDPYEWFEAIQIAVDVRAVRSERVRPAGKPSASDLTALRMRRSSARPRHYLWSLTHMHRRCHVTSQTLMCCGRPSIRFHVSARAPSKSLSKRSTWNVCGSSGSLKRLSMSALQLFVSGVSCPPRRPPLPIREPEPTTL